MGIKLQGVNLGYMGLDYDILVSTHAVESGPVWWLVCAPDVAPRPQRCHCGLNASSGFSAGNGTGCGALRNPPTILR